MRLKRNVPNLRFKEFEGEWKEKRLGEVGESFIGLTYKPTDIVAKDGIIVFRSSNIQNGVIDYKDIVRVDRKVKEKLITKKDDLLVCARNGSTRLIGKNALLKEVDSNQTFGAFMMVFRSDKNRFVHQLLNTKRYMSQISENLGARINQITSADLSSFKFFFPQNYEEIQKIASFLDLLDERIATQNKIIDKLESLIKGLNQRLLCNNKWKTYKIKDIADIGRGRVISSIEIEQQHQPKYPVYSSQTSNNGIMGYLDDYMFDGEYITWTTDGANAGTVFYRNGKFNCTNVCGTLKINQEHNCYFVSLVLQQSTHYYVSTNLANPKLMNNTMASIKIKLPNIEEQNYLSKIFFLLNEHLYTNIRINKFYLEQKQYLLRHMFI